MSLDQGKYKILFDEYYNPLCNYANSILKDPDRSEDAVQDVFLQIWNKKNDIKEENIKAFLFISAKNKALEILRKAKRNQNLIKEVPIYDNNIESEKFEIYIKLEKVYNSIRQLPEKCKNIFVLNKINGLTYNEIASDLNISVRTVESQMGKALRLLRQMVKQ